MRVFIEGNVHVAQAKKYESLRVLLLIKEQKLIRVLGSKINSSLFKINNKETFHLLKDPGFFVKITQLTVGKNCFWITKESKLF